MKTLAVPNPFDGPVYYEETVSSTMDVSRTLARNGAPHGTVITAGYQSRGKGRGPSRLWNMEKGKDLAFTILLRYNAYSSIPAAVTLRAGLAVSLAVEDFAPALGGEVKVKWPNDIMLGPKKAAGILAETDGSSVHIGIGVNTGRREFPGEYGYKAVSLAAALEETGATVPEDARFVLLEKILSRLHGEIETPPGGGSGSAGPAGSWPRRLEARLYMKGKEVRFIEGPADSGRVVSGVLEGIGPAGELLIIPRGEKTARPFVNGELDIYSL
jgi:BirA family biotin operon repressor/biotin-[acetyl-CoA-carboxylase] ligase